MRNAGSASAARAPLALAGLAPAAVAGALASLLWWLAAGPGSGASALLGTACALAFFACAAVVLAPGLRRLPPQSLLLVALCAYTAQMAVLFGVFWWSRSQAWIDGGAAGLTVLLVAIVWQVAAVRTWRRSRVLVYDESSQFHRGVG